MATEKKKILLVIPTLGSGGAQRALTRLSILLGMYYEIFICVFNRQVEVVYPYRGNVVSLDDFPTGGLIQKIRRFIGRVKKLRSVKRELDVDVSISFLEGANYINVLSRGSEKVIISLRGSVFHDVDFRGFGGWIRKHVLMRVLYRKARHVVTLSDGLKEEVKDRLWVPADRVTTIYNHYDFDELVSLSRQPIPSHLQGLFNKPVIVMSGRLHPQKGHREFMEIFKRLRETVDCRLVIFGDGVIRNEVIDKSRSLGLRTYTVWGDEQLRDEHEVVFLGYLRDPFHFIRKSTVFVFPSLYEGLGNALVEALACRVVILASDCHSGPREVLAPGTRGSYNLDQAEFAAYGILMPVPDRSAAKTVWVEMLTKVLSDDSIRQQYAAVGESRLSDFSADAICTQWRRLIA